MKKSPHLLICLALVLLAGFTLPNVCFASPESMQRVVASQNQPERAFIGPIQEKEWFDGLNPLPMKKSSIATAMFAESSSLPPSCVQTQRLARVTNDESWYRLELYVDKNFMDVDKVNIRISFQNIDLNHPDEWTLTYDMWSEYASFFKYDQKNQPVKDHKWGKNVYAYQKIDERVEVKDLMPGVPMRFRLTIDGANHEPIISKIVEFILPMPEFTVELVGKKDGSNNIYLQADVDTSPLPAALWQATYSYKAEVRTATGWTSHEEYGVVIDEKHLGPKDGYYTGPKFKMSFAVLACCPNAYYTIVVKLTSVSLFLKDYPIDDGQIKNVPLKMESAPKRTFTDYLALDWAIIDSITRYADPYTGEPYSKPVVVFRGWVKFDYPDTDRNQLAYFQLCSSDDRLPNGAERFSPCIPLLCEARKVNSRPDKYGRTFFEFEQAGLKAEIDSKGQIPTRSQDVFKKCEYFLKFFPKDKYGKAQCIHEKSNWESMFIDNLGKEPPGDPWFNHLEN